MAEAIRDGNHVTNLLLESSSTPGLTLNAKGDQSTGRLLTDNASASGTVMSVSVATANGFSGTVATPTTTPEITIQTTVTGILKGNGTAISAATAGTDYVTASSINTFTNKTYDTAGTGNAFSINGTSITTVTGTGSVVLASSPVLTTPNLGTPTTLVGTNITGTAASLSIGGTAAIATTVTVADSTDSTCWVSIFEDATGNLAPKTDGALTYNASTGALTATSFVGSITGNAATVTFANEATDATCFIAFGTAASGSLPVSTNANMTFASNTGIATFASTVLTTTDINGGTVDGAVIGGASAAAGTFTTGTINTSLTMADAANIIVNATTGTKIGTATSQKIGFFNATPIVQPTGDIVTAMQNLGLGASLTVSAATTITTANEATDTTCFPLFVTASGTQTLQPKNNTGLTFNSNTASLGATLMTATTSLTTASVLASSNDSGALGASGTAFADLFLASGGVINFNAGNVTLTHSAGILTQNSGELRITSANVGTNGDSVPTLSSTSTMTNKTLTSPTLTTPSAFTTGGTITLAENTSVALDPAGSADGKYSGITMTATGGATIAFGDLLYLDAATSRWKLTDADASATGGPVDIAMAVTSSSDGGALTILRVGNIRADAKFPTLTIGAPVYLGETAGAIQVAIPTGADNVIRVVGFALTADEIYFNPSQDHQISVA